jgi:hypothetical protein
VYFVVGNLCAFSCAAARASSAAPGVILWCISRALVRPYSPPGVARWRNELVAVACFYCAVSGDCGRVGAGTGSSVLAASGPPGIFMRRFANGAPFGVSQCRCQQLGKARRRLGVNGSRLLMRSAAWCCDRITAGYIDGTDAVLKANQFRHWRSSQNSAYGLAAEECWRSWDCAAQNSWSRGRALQAHQFVATGSLWVEHHCAVASVQEVNSAEFGLAGASRVTTRSSGMRGSGKAVQNPAAAALCTKRLESAKRHPVLRLPLKRGAMPLSS